MQRLTLTDLTRIVSLEHVPGYRIQGPDTLSPAHEPMTFRDAMRDRITSEQVVHPTGVLAQAWLPPDAYHYLASQLTHRIPAELSKTVIDLLAPEKGDMVVIAEMSLDAHGAELIHEGPNTAVHAKVKINLVTFELERRSPVEWPQARDQERDD